MKTLNIVFDDDTSKVLDKVPNKSEFVREAIRLYDDYARTDTKAQIIHAFKHMENTHQETQARVNEMYEMLESVKNMLEEALHK